jgi:hypothetical protein
MDVEQIEQLGEFPNRAKRLSSTAEESPVGTAENSPAIYCWVRTPKEQYSVFKPRQGRKRVCLGTRAPLSSLAGLVFSLRAVTQQ